MCGEAKSHYISPTSPLHLPYISPVQVVVCGEAKSHCVNFTLRDLLSAWPAARVG